MLRTVIDTYKKDLRCYKNAELNPKDYSAFFFVCNTKKIALLKPLVHKHLVYSDSVKAEKRNADISEIPKYRQVSNGARDRDRTGTPLRGTGF